MGRASAVTSGAAAHLRRRPVLLHGWREGAGVGVGSRRFHIVVAEAAEERAEDASVPLLLQTAVGLGRCQNRRQERERAAGEQAGNANHMWSDKKKKNWTWGTFTFSRLHAGQWGRNNLHLDLGLSSYRRDLECD